MANQTQCELPISQNHFAHSFLVAGNSGSLGSPALWSKSWTSHESCRLRCRQFDWHRIGISFGFRVFAVLRRVFAWKTWKLCGVCSYIQGKTDILKVQLLTGTNCSIGWVSTVKMHRRTMHGISIGNFVKSHTTLWAVYAAQRSQVSSRAIWKVRTYLLRSNLFLRCWLWSFEPTNLRIQFSNPEPKNLCNFVTPHCETIWSTQGICCTTCHAQSVCARYVKANLFLACFLCRTWRLQLLFPMWRR